MNPQNTSTPPQGSQFVNYSGSRRDAPISSPGESFRMQPDSGISRNVPQAEKGAYAPVPAKNRSHMRRFMLVLLDILVLAIVAFIILDYK